MTPERWQRMESLFDSALQLAPEERQRFLQAQCGADDSLRHQVEEMLRHQAGGETVQQLIQDAATAVVAARDAWEGRRLGPYQIVRTIGKGGMGAVFLAVRNDDEYRKEVAIKVLKFEASDSYILNRFRFERQVLAGLEHPNIGRLLDGGTSADGMPYIVMEYIAGIPISDYCREKKISIPARLRLFQQVCEAVQYAHGMLVVHRDIKPSNILVTAEGVPKLLDFGIAKLLDPAPAEAVTRTLTGILLMTPEYASPEQVRGESVSVATDVYSLGIVLYGMLTGRQPYEVPSQSPLAIERAVCDTQPDPPGISGDLDNILLMALRKEPQRRYASVRQFADDIERSLTNRPVLARPDTIGYRSAKFIRRHQFSLAAGVLILLTLLGGVLVSQYQARRAERLFREVREIANVFLFDFDESIRDLPGATKARERLVGTAQKYLARLAGEAGSDPDLMAELAVAYDKIGDVQGNLYAANLGRIAEGMASWHQSLALWERVLARRPNDVRALRSAAGVLVKLADHETRRKTDNPADSYRKATDLAERAMAINPNDEEALFSASRVWHLRGEERRLKDDIGPAEAAFTRSLELDRVGASKWPSNRWKSAVAIKLGSVSTMVAARGDVPRSVELMKEVIAIQREMVAANPGSYRYQRSLAVALQQIGNKYGYPPILNMGDAAAARRSYREAIEIEERLAAADSANETLRYDLALFYRLLGLVTLQEEPAAAEKLVEKTLATVALIRAPAGQDILQRNIRGAHEGLARIELQRRQYASALKHVSLALNTLHVMPADVRLPEFLHGDILHAMGQPAEARAVWDEVRQDIERIPRSEIQPVDWRDLGEAYRRLGVSCAGLKAGWETSKVPMAWPVKDCH